MSDIIRVKRSDTTATPATLSAGELAYSEDSGNFFYGRIADGAPVVIGGKTAIDKLATIESSATADQTGAEIEGLLDTELANTDWKKAVGTAAGTVAAGDLALNDISNVNAGTPSDTQVLTWDNATSKWIAAANPAGVTSFIALNDTPVNFTSAGGYIVKVNAGADALEFVNGIDGGSF